VRAECRQREEQGRVRARKGKRGVRLGPVQAL
jgi:hypothetical protein